MTRHWFEDGPEPEVFREAADGIGAPGFRIRDSASYASARYSGAFCLLALRNARDWRRAGEEPEVADEVAADVRAGTAPFDEAVEELQLGNV